MHDPDDALVIDEESLPCSLHPVAAMGEIEAWLAEARHDHLLAARPPAVTLHGEGLSADVAMAVVQQHLPRRRQVWSAPFLQDPGHPDAFPLANVTGFGWSWVGYLLLLLEERRLRSIDFEFLAHRAAFDGQWMALTKTITALDRVCPCVMVDWRREQCVVVAEEARREAFFAERRPTIHP